MAACEAYELATVLTVLLSVPEQFTKCRQTLSKAINACAWHQGSSSRAANGHVARVVLSLAARAKLVFFWLRTLDGYLLELASATMVMQAAQQTHDSSPVRSVQGNQYRDPTSSWHCLGPGPCTAVMMSRDDRLANGPYAEGIHIARQIPTTANQLLTNAAHLSSKDRAAWAMSRVVHVYSAPHLGVANSILSKRCIWPSYE